MKKLIIGLLLASYALTTHSQAQSIEIKERSAEISNQINTISFNDFYSEYFKSPERKVNMPVLLYAIDKDYINIALQLINQENIDLDFGHDFTVGRTKLFKTPLSLSIEKNFIDIVECLVMERVGR